MLGRKERGAWSSTSSVRTCILQEVIGSLSPQRLSQTGHWWDVLCSRWHGLFMSTNFLCSFRAMLESLGIILLLPCSARALELWQSYLWEDFPLCNTQHLISGTHTALIPWGRLPQWDHNLGNIEHGLQLGPTNASTVLTSPPSPLPLYHARETFSNLKQKFCGLLWCVSHTFCLCQFSSFPSGFGLLETKALKTFFALSPSPILELERPSSGTINIVGPSSLHMARAGRREKKHGQHF